MARMLLLLLKIDVLFGGSVFFDTEKIIWITSTVRFTSLTRAFTAAVISVQILFVLSLFWNIVELR